MPVSERTSVEDFVLAHLPAPPAPVLEVGAGRGDLARSLVGRGYRVTAIDPDAGQGGEVERVAIGDFVSAETFGAVVACRVLHHVVDLDAALDRIAAVLDPGGLIIVHEFAWDRVTGVTARWLFEALRSRPSGRSWPSFEDWHACWTAEHADLHGFERLMDGLGAHFTRQRFAWVPYLAVEYIDPELEPSEQDLIDSGAIQASGFRYVGRRR